MLTRVGDDRKIKAVSATGALAAPFIQKYMGMIREKFPNVEVDVVSIRNEFFGETITVSGLITGQDLIRTAKRQRPWREAFASLQYAEK